MDEKARKWQSLNAKRYGEKRKRLGRDCQGNGVSMGLNGYFVSGLKHVLFVHVVGILIPTDSYFSERLKPPSRYVIGVFFGYISRYISISMI